MLALVPFSAVPLSGLNSRFFKGEGEEKLEVELGPFFPGSLEGRGWACEKINSKRRLR